ncbi:MAG: aminomethyltransferase family protein [Pyrinomonadaceae bacterium]
MSEVVQQVISQHLPLHEAHEQAGASFVEREGWLLPASYADLLVEYNAVREGHGAGIIDLSSRGRVRVSGTEAVQFLNGLVTNDVKTLQPNTWMTAAFPNAQGRLVAPARILRIEDSFLIDTDAATSERVRKTLERFTLAGDFRVADIAKETVLLSLQGERAAEIIANLFDQSTSHIAPWHALQTSWREHQIIIMRATHTNENGFDLFVPTEAAQALWTAFQGAAGARPIGYDVYETLRIEAGIPRYGVDMDETNVVTESLAEDEAVSYQKGCYIGQEIIARIHWRGHVAKKLTGLVFDEGAQNLSPMIGAKLKSADGKEIGRVTSQTFSPRLDKAIALAYVKYDYLAPDTRAHVITGDTEYAARVAALPLVCGSWYEQIDTHEVENA